jgi:hypothetical protein
LEFEFSKSGRCVSPHKQKPHRPGIAPALGLRAGSDVSSLYRRPSEGANYESPSVRDDSLLPPVAPRPWPHPHEPAKGAASAAVLEALESRDVPSALSVADTSAVEGASALNFVDQFVTPGSGGLKTPRTPIFGPDGNLYVASALTNSVLRYDGVTGAFKDTFVAASSGGLNGPGDLAFGPDGNLYVSSYAGNQVLSYNGSTGAFLNVVATGLSSPLGITFGSDGSLYIANSGTNEVLRESNGVLSSFVTAGSGGLTTPRKAVFGSDGNLYVASQDTKQVLRYNGTTGAFKDVFATMPSSVLGTGTMWLEFGTDGYLYTTARYSSTSLNVNIIRFNATTGAFVDSFALGRDGWSFNLSPNNVVFDSGNGAGNFVDRYGPSSLEAFTVSLDSASSSAVTVSYSTADGTAVAGTNYTAASGTVTFPSGVTSQTILVPTLDDGVANGTTTFTVNLSNPVGATISRGQATGTIIDGDKTKFFTVDAGSTATTFRYGLSGNTFASSTLSSGDSAPRGVAANAAGTTVWVVDGNKTVYVYDPSGNLLGSWTAGGLSHKANLQGIATDGTNIWVVDKQMAKVYQYTGAASRRSGSQSAASSFSLDSTNANPQDIVTDGSSFWVVDGTAFKVFKYTISGSLLGSWAIDPANTHPTGITINPNNVSDIWIADNGTNTVFRYAAAAGLTSGSQTASSIFALAAGDTNPQGIADPPVPGTISAPAPTAPATISPPILAPAPALQPSLLVPVPLGRDAFFALLGNAPSTGPVKQSIQRPTERNVPAILPPSPEAATILAARTDAVFAGSQQGDDVLIDMPMLPEEDVSVAVE